MTALNIVNLITTTFCLAAFFFTVRIYLLLRAPALLVLCAAVAYISCVRVAITLAQFCDPVGWLPKHSSFFLVAYYPLLALAFYLLYKQLRQFKFNGNGG